MRPIAIAALERQENLMPIMEDWSHPLQPFSEIAELDDVTLSQVVDHYDAFGDIDLPNFTLSPWSLDQDLDLDPIVAKTKIDSINDFSLSQIMDNYDQFGVSGSALPSVTLTEPVVAQNTIQTGNYSV